MRDELRSTMVSRVEFVSTGKNARSTAVFVRDKGRYSYRPQFFTNDINWSTSYLIDKLLDSDALSPGDVGIVEGVLLSPSMFPDLKIGDRFSLAEGSKVVASGEVLEIRLPSPYPHT